VKNEKTRNDKQWTEARFRGFITTALRSATRRWPPKYGCLKAAFVGVKKNPKSGRDAKHYRCATCESEFPQSGVQVDHIEPVGSTSSWDEFIEKLFCEADNLQVLCKGCHKKKSAAEREENASSRLKTALKQKKGRSSSKGKSRPKS
jgi:5-methylcytosine-specific restriction endonuclease McrA